ncbi:MAG: transcription termination factor Rho, partial [Phycisphaerales bacterium]
MTSIMNGILVWPDGRDGRLRQIENGFAEQPGDPWVPAAIREQFPLRSGQLLRVEVSDAPPKRKSRRRRRRKGNNNDNAGADQTTASNGQATSHSNGRLTVQNVLEIEGLDPEVYAARTPFEELTALDPQPRLTLEYKNCPPACRLIDLFCPIGYGTRGLIVAPPKAGKTVLLKQIASGITHNHPEVEVVALLIDERPEEVTDFKRNVPAQVLASSNDQNIAEHIELAMLTVDRARRIVEAGRDVVVLLDSLTRVGRAFNNSRKYASSGRTMTGGLDSRALDMPKQLFGAARKAEQGGSLTMIATCLVDTGSRADQIIFEEFKGTGNMELILDRSISERRLYPAINLAASGARKEDLLMSPEELKTVTALRRRLTNMPPHVQIEQLL